MSKQLMVDPIKFSVTAGKVNRLISQIDTYYENIAYYESVYFSDMEGNSKERIADVFEQIKRKVDTDLEKISIFYYLLREIRVEYEYTEQSIVHAINQ